MSMALLIIDVQRGVFDEAPRPYEADEVVDRINALSRRAREQRALVVVVQHERATGSLKYGSTSWELVESLQTAPTDYFIRKRTSDAFLDTELHEILISRSIDTLVICGAASEFCIDSTTRRAAALGYSVTLAADAHTTRDKEHLSAAAIREHENLTLASITNFGPTIDARASAGIGFSLESEC